MSAGGSPPHRERRARSAFAGSVAEDLVEHRGGGLGIDGADDGDLEVVAGERVFWRNALRSSTVIAATLSGVAFDGPAIGLVREQGRLHHRLAASWLGLRSPLLDAE